MTVPDATGSEISALRKALDAVTAGDEREATAILLNVIERGGPGLPPKCDVCGARAWPGDTGRHFGAPHREYDRRNLADAA